MADKERVLVVTVREMEALAAERDRLKALAEEREGELAELLDYAERGGSAYEEEGFSGYSDTARKLFTLLKTMREDAMADAYLNQLLDEKEASLNTLQALHPSEFKALWNAKCLPNSGTHNGAYRAPGGTDDETLRRLLERGLLQANPERRGFYVLTDAGKALIGVVEA
jgi:hypothetical protein